MPDLNAVKSALRRQQIELPLWAFGDAGTRLKLLAQPGAARTPQEKIEDAAQVHALTGVAPRVAIHIPRDRVDDYAGLARFAAEHGVAIGAVNASAFLDDDCMLGSIAHPDPAVRRQTVDHLLECVDVMDATGSADLKVWSGDGFSYAGQDDIRGRQARITDALTEVYERLGGQQGLLLEHELSEPSYYATDMPDWGTSLLHCLALGPRAQVVVDTTCHTPGLNTDFIVALLLRAGRLGGLNVNSPLHAADDLMVGAADPFQLFGILHQVVAADAHLPPAGVTLMLDQCHYLEPKVPAQIRSVLSVQEATAKAMLIDAAALAAAQQAGDVLAANAVFMDAYHTDTRPLLADLREEMGLDRDPVAAYRRSGYQEHIVSTRVGDTIPSWT